MPIKFAEAAYLEIKDKQPAFDGGKSLPSKSIKHYNNFPQ